MTYSKDWCRGFCRNCGTGCAQYSEEVFQIRKERDKYKAAIEKIVIDNEDNTNFPDTFEEARYYLRVAKEALEEK